MIYNPTTDTITRTISLPLYYTGLADTVLVMLEGQTPGMILSLDRDCNVQVTVTMEPRTVTWVLIQDAP